ncbi:hypothetical protein KC19_4G177700 [Ceratodon purpureus]|uniref:DUF4378 domain-containing protein n=1 Tax=Ceratodon purpureus TaxID=3225 RepID=A0A8T0IC46_CERPU|nr:hypothetical protein KC19_4G177700 [Ceratodon purpureus]
MGHRKTCEAPQKMPSARNGVESLYCDAVQQLEQLQLQNVRKTMKKYLQSTEVKDWLRLKRRKSVQMIHPAPYKDPRLDDTKNHEQDQLNQRHSSPNHSVNLECHPFPKYRTQKVEDIGNQNERNLLDRSRQKERVREIRPGTERPSRTTTKPASSNRKTDCLFNEPETSQITLPPSSSELGRYSKRIGTTKTSRRSSRATTKVGCDTLSRRSSNASTKDKPQSPQVGLPPTNTECSSTFFHIRNTKYDSEEISTPTINLERRPASMVLRRELNCKTLIEELKRQRAPDAEESRKSERLDARIMNAPTEIVIMRSHKQHFASNRNRFMNKTKTAALSNEDKHFISRSETTTGNYFQEWRSRLEEVEGCNETTRPRYQIGSERPNSRSTLVSSLTRSRPFATAPETTAILQDALEALECAHRWNEWGARTLHQLARASKAAVERNHSLLDWPRIDKPKRPKILLPHDDDIVISNRQGRVLESREEERVFIRDLLVGSGLTNGDWVERHLLDATHEHIVQRPYTRYKHQEDFPEVVLLKRKFTAEQRNKRRVMDRHILCDFVEELLRHELVLRECAQLGIYLTTLRDGHELKGQALVQKVWNKLQTCPAPASNGICTTVQLVLERDLKDQDPTLVEVYEVGQELDEMIFENLVQELLEELQQVAVLR